MYGHFPSSRRNERSWWLWRKQYPYKHLSNHLEHVRRTCNIDTQVFTHLLTHVGTFASTISACERLLRAPLPLAFNIIICRLGVAVCALHPVAAVARAEVVGSAAVVAYTLVALAEIGLEVENLWGEGMNDLDLDRYCNLPALDLDEIVGGGRSKSATPTGSGRQTPSGYGRQTSSGYGRQTPSGSWTPRQTLVNGEEDVGDVV